MFEKIIGYRAVKEALLQILDMMKQREKYERLGARIPRGVLLNGKPGIGKSMMAMGFMGASGRKCYTLRRNAPGGDFVREIKRTFDEAASNVPAVILLDDMDKFVTEEKNSEEYVAVQACIDEVRDKDVFVIATANNLKGIPDSLLRAGRFDRHILMRFPEGKDAEDIIRYYLQDKPVEESINYGDIGKMFSGSSCATMESVLNEAAIAAAYHGKERIGMEEVVKASLRQVYGISEERPMDNDHLRAEAEKIAYHEAGHAVIAEIIKEGCVGALSLNAQSVNEKGGFMLRCRELDRRAHYILVALGGKAAFELQYGTVASGTSGDLQDAMRHLDTSVTGIGTLGLGLLDTDVGGTPISEFMQECAAHAEIERYLFKAKEILAQNREFLHVVARELLEKKTLLFSDMRRIREGVRLQPAVIG